MDGRRQGIFAVPSKGRIGGSACNLACVLVCRCSFPDSLPPLQPPSLPPQSPGRERRTKRAEWTRDDAAKRRPIEERSRLRERRTGDRSVIALRAPTLRPPTVSAVRRWRQLRARREERRGERQGRRARGDGRGPEETQAAWRTRSVGAAGPSRSTSPPSSSLLFAH